MIFIFIDRFLVKLTVKAIRFYQKTLSLDHGPLRHLKPFGQCRFHPTCSEYAVQALEKKGFIKGMVLTIWRVLRCNPFSRGGVDEIK